MKKHRGMAKGAGLPDQNAGKALGTAKQRLVQEALRQVKKELVPTNASGYRQQAEQAEAHVVVVMEDVHKLKGAVSSFMERTAAVEKKLSGIESLLQAQQTVHKKHHHASQHHHGHGIVHHEMHADGHEHHDIRRFTEMATLVFDRTEALEKRLHAMERTSRPEHAKTDDEFRRLLHSYLTRLDAQQTALAKFSAKLDAAMARVVDCEQKASAANAALEKIKAEQHASVATHAGHAQQDDIERLKRLVVGMERSKVDYREMEELKRSIEDVSRKNKQLLDLLIAKLG
ncbi:MAG: hypothetical protein HY519_03975 [Candidatus Aenigmarchaeota archaeon]|nr:hypothetical protein [Candidatus Aenigmarchaeota archaeon]